MSAMKLKREIVEALRNQGRNPVDELSDMLLRDLEELAGKTENPRQHFLVTRMEMVLCERLKPKELEEP